MTQMIAERCVRQAGTNFVDSVAIFLPRMVTTLAIVVVGWLIAMLLRTSSARVAGWSRIQRRGRAHRRAAVLKTADLPPADVLLARSCSGSSGWGSCSRASTCSASRLSKDGASASGLFVPRLLVAVVILIIGFVVANFAWRATLLAAVNARVPSPRLLSGAVRWLILILAGAMALEQIAVARTIVLTAFAIAFGALMLAVAIAFGIGGGGIAKRILEHQFPEQPRSSADEISHL